jgi:integrase
MCETELSDESFAFSFEPGGKTPPYPDVMSHAFASLRKRAKVASDIHLHSLRHFQATVLDSVVSERQKQARLGWATVHMARHYTDALSEEDQKAAEFVGRLLDDARPQVGQDSRNEA